jgi:hypothetical protein
MRVQAVVKGSPILPTPLAFRALVRRLQPRLRWLWGVVEHHNTELGEDGVPFCDDSGVFRLLQAVTQEPQELHYVLMPHEHRNTAQRAATLSLRKFPVYPSDLVGVPEANLGRLPPDGEVFLIPYPPDPACLQPLGKLLWLVM